MVFRPVKAIKANYWLIMSRPPLTITNTNTPLQTVSTTTATRGVRLQAGELNTGDQGLQSQSSRGVGGVGGGRCWYAGSSVTPQYHNYADMIPETGPSPWSRCDTQISYLSHVGCGYINNLTSSTISYPAPPPSLSL